MKIFHFQIELVSRGLTPGDAFAHAVHKLSCGEDEDVLHGEVVFKTLEQEEVEDEFLSELVAASAWKELIVGET